MQTTKIFNCVTCPYPNPHASVRLFCLPYAGASSLIFRRWLTSLPTTVEVCPIELPGRGLQSRLTPFSRLQPLISTLTSALLPYLDKPFAFFGHSLGGLVSFELARQLRREYNLSPVHLFVSARRAPQIPSPKPPIHALPDTEFIEELRRFNGTPDSVLQNTELMELLMPILRADFAMLETYVYAQEPPLECPITVFGGLEDEEASLEELKAWRSHTIASYNLQMFRGDHFFIQSEQPLLLQTLAEHLQALT
ncbi:MAG: thioesterase II family protein [Tolypothrix brevis GSE-NOS-MK-07-07A]|nr:thioesterase II family protein [Tolypothrix brevis GSE-NOS-MK-07-07A]